MMNNFTGCATMTIEDVKKAQEALHRQEVLMKHGVEMPKITQKADGRFCMNIPASYSLDSKRHQIVARTQAELIEKFNERVYTSITEAESAELKSVNDMVEEWLQSRKYGLKGQSRNRYMGIYKNHIQKTAFGQSKIQEVKLPECQEFIDSLYHKKIGAKTISGIKSILSMTFEYAIAHDYILRNYFTTITINRNLCYRGSHRATMSWTKEEELKLWDTSVQQWKQKRSRNSAAIMFMIYTGMRAGELLSATWDDVDWEEKALTIERTRVSYRDIDTGEMVVGDSDSTKTESSRRTIRLNPAAMYWLREIKKRAVYVGRGDSRYIVTGKTVEQISQTYFDNIIQRFCKKAGVKYQSSHANRKTYATSMIDGHVPVTEVSADLGHKNITTTQNVYYTSRATSEEVISQKNAVVMATVGNRLTAHETA